MSKTENIIICPYCGAEYLPEEIFIPEDLFNQPRNILKDEHGKLEHFVRDDLSFEEEYTCDYCNHTFKVHCFLTFTTEKCLEHDFDFDHETEIYPNRISLEE